MNKLSFYFYRTILWLWDIITLNLVLFTLSYFVERANAFEENQYLLYFFAFNIFWMAAVFVTALYLSKNWLDIQSFAKQTLKCFVLTVLGCLFFIFLSKYEYSRLFISLSFASFGVALLINRVVFWGLVESLKNNFQLKKNVIVLGYNNIQ